MKKKTLIALGDSITYGWPYEPEVSWVNTLQKNISYLSVFNKGISGDTFADMLSRLQDEVLVYEPDYCIVMGGANEAYQHIPQSVLKRNFLNIVEQLEEKNCKIIIGLPTPVDDYLLERYLQDIRIWVIEYCRKRLFPVLDFYGLMLDKNNNINNSLFIDGCHPNQRGYELMGKYALSRLLELEINN